MVAQLDCLVQQSAVSPEVQWRSRIMLRSAQEADRDIAEKLYRYEKTLVDAGGHGRDARTAQTACMKLHRDYRRIHKALCDTMQEYERRQRADISLLGGATDSRSREVADPALTLQQEQVGTKVYHYCCIEEEFSATHLSFCYMERSCNFLSPKSHTQYVPFAYRRTFLNEPYESVTKKCKRSTRKCTKSILSTRNWQRL